MNFFIIVLFSFTLALHIFTLDATQDAMIGLLGRPISWQAEYRLEVDYETCCQDMCRANDSCKSFDQIWQPSRDIYECHFYSKNYQVLKAEGEKLVLVPRVQYFSKMYQLYSCQDWYLYGGARKDGIDYQMSDGTKGQCNFTFYSCDDPVYAGLLQDEGVFPIYLEGISFLWNWRYPGKWRVAIKNGSL